MNMIYGDQSDLSAFRDKGGKLMISHCTNDSLVFPGGTIEPYHRITEKMGGEEKTLPFVRFFLTPGGSHCFHAALGIPLADGMIKLMQWVEQDMAPEKVPLEAYDLSTLPAKCLLRKEGVLYRLSEHTDFEYAVSPLRDVSYEDDEEADKALITDLIETSREKATGIVEEMKGKYMSMSAMFGTGQ
ncbi:MAG: tannase/feruloyl esterase family alpha/beta hydrolase [Oribacterium sp.]|nr:tannase/feruloyl esterase family alpha/beta hydrolase [Oribacterium sp.]